MARIFKHCYTTLDRRTGRRLLRRTRNWYIEYRDERGRWRRVAGREWLYTAVSRASKLCILIGKRETALKQIRQVQLDRRQTFLTELLKGEAK